MEDLGSERWESRAIMSNTLSTDSFSSKSESVNRSDCREISGFILGAITVAREFN